MAPAPAFSLISPGPAPSLRSSLLAPFPVPTRTLHHLPLHNLCPSPDAPGPALPSQLNFPGRPQPSRPRPSPQVPPGPLLRVPLGPALPPHRPALTLARGPIPPPAHRFLRPAVPQMTFMFSKRMLLTPPLSMAPGSSASSASSTSRWVRSCSGWGSRRASLSRPPRVQKSPPRIPLAELARVPGGIRGARITPDGRVPTPSRQNGEDRLLPGRNASTVIQGHSPDYQFSPTDSSEVTNGTHCANLKTFPATGKLSAALEDFRRFKYTLSLLYSH